jgi:dolichol-phosphate mannosyltransferase
MGSESALSVELSLIVPTYNERGSLIPLVERIHRALSNCIYELIVVDDDSPDGTAELAESLAEKYPIKVIRRKNERGLATAVVEGTKHALGSVLGVIDADLQHPPEVIPELLQKIWGGADIAIATRYIKGGGTQGWSLPRRIVSKAATGLAHLLLPVTRKIKDPLSGFFLAKREVVDGIKLKPTGYKILLEVLVKGRIGEVAIVPYTFGARAAGCSKFGFREQMSYLKHLYRLSEADKELKRFFKFCIVGGSGILVNMGLLWLLTEVAGLFYLVSAIFGIEASILSNFALNELWTFRDKRTGSARDALRRALKFNLLCGIGVGINLGVLYALTEAFGLYYLASNLIGIAIATLWNFGANARWTWNGDKRRDGII